MIIQIYSLTSAKAACAVAKLGVDHIGFVAGRYNIVRSELNFDQARDLVKARPSGVKSVALTMATDVDEIMKMVDAVRPDIVHISTDPLDMDKAATQELGRRLPSHIQLMKAIPVGGSAETLDLIRRFEPVADLFLLDTKVEGFPGVGATGHTHDWNVSRQVVETTRRPVILAGGLIPENVQESIKKVGPWGVDSCTGTNIPGTNEKDMARVQEFVQAVRHWEQENA